MKFALIGNGFIGPRHIAAINSVGGELVAVCDIDESRKMEGVPFFTDYRDAIENADAVSICTPNYLHVPIALHCIEKGKCVLSEKPLGLSVEEISKLPNGGQVLTVLQLRHHPEVINLKNTLDASFHNVEMKIIVNRGESYWNGWKGDITKSGGMLMNIGIHYFDLLMHLFGQKYEIRSAEYSPNYAKGSIVFPNAQVNFEVGIISTSEGQDRMISIDGQSVSLSKQDNLSFEALHDSVYEDFVAGKGILPSEAALSIKMVEDIMSIAQPLSVAGNVGAVIS